MKILLLGADGQIGWQLRRALAPLGSIKACNRSEANLEKPEQIKALITEYSPNIIVNAAAYTAVDKAEEEFKKAALINISAVALIAEEAKKLNALLVHYSTDYVFDGKKSSGYTEDDLTYPLSIYGKTKLEGENKIRESGCNHLIFRTSWVYSNRRNNFIKTIIRLANERKELRIVSDQIGSPTSADFIADVTAHCIIQNHNYKKYGIYNLTSSGEVSWHGLAKFAISELQKDGVNFKTKLENIIPITTEEYPLPAKRPKHSTLNTDKIKKTFKINIPDWQYHVKMMLDSYTNR
jgi:dTDP-4-dehydrorhamnose reductase